MAAMPHSALVLIGAKVDPELKQQLGQFARSNERTVSQEIRLALRLHMQLDLPIVDARTSA
jgi:hypothetical protein